jgi:hypothetical protein
MDRLVEQWHSGIHWLDKTTLTICLSCACALATTHTQNPFKVKCFMCTQPYVQTDGIEKPHFPVQSGTKCVNPSTFQNQSFNYHSTVSHIVYTIFTQFFPLHNSYIWFFTVKLRNKILEHLSHFFLVYSQFTIFQLHIDHAYISEEPYMHQVAPQFEQPRNFQTLPMYLLQYAAAVYSVFIFSSSICWIGAKL